VLPHLDEVTKASARVGLDDALELLFFASREIVREPDRLLSRRRLGRVHHRVLYMCRRNADLSVSELVHLLEVTKQALHRPLAELGRAGLLVAAPGPGDRRTRRLKLTAKGRTLEEQLSQLQRDEFARAFAAVGETGAQAWARVMSVLGHDKTAARLRAAAKRPRDQAGRSRGGAASRRGRGR
jgi:DNA-binding MarR family transcriptional regulator